MCVIRVLSGGDRIHAIRLKASPTTNGNRSLNLNRASNIRVVQLSFALNENEATETS